jgi:hypothetical protein
MQGFRFFAILRLAVCFPADQPVALALGPGLQGGFCPGPCSQDATEGYPLKPSETAALYRLHS